MDKFALNKMVVPLMERTIERVGSTKSDIQRKSGIKHAYFSHLVNYGSSYGKPMDEDHAKRILLACDYKLSEVRRIISQARVMDAISGLDEPDRGAVIQSIVGDNNIQISR